MSGTGGEARRIVEALGGRWSGRGGVCFCPAHDNRRTPALSVSEADDGRLLLHCHSGCTFPDIIDALAARGLIDQGGSGGREHREEEATPWALRANDSANDRSAARARALWQSSRPITGTPAETYLATRCIVGPLPSSLRFHSTATHPSGVCLPTMVSRVDGAAAFAVHRTFLRPDGGAKASVEPGKAMLGGCAGGGVLVAEGVGPLVVAEGIETALSVARMLPEHGPVWAALSASGMAGFGLPDHPGRLVVAVDGDEAGRTAGRKLGNRAHAAGWSVEWADPGNNLDFNDILRADLAQEGNRWFA